MIVSVRRQDIIKMLTNKVTIFHLLYSRLTHGFLKHLRMWLADNWIFSIVAECHSLKEIINSK